MPHLGIAGAGCYFDLGDDASARTFALERAHGDPEQAVVIRATIHDMCLHPGRCDPGALGDALARALHWNGPCPVQQRGLPVFYALLTLAYPIEEWEAAGEYMRLRIAHHLALHERITTENIHHYIAAYQHARAVIGARAS